MEELATARLLRRNTCFYRTGKSSLKSIKDQGALLLHQVDKFSPKQHCNIHNKKNHSMKPLTVFFALIFLSGGPAFAQKTVYWTGGTPGQEINWHCPNNWDNGKVPDWTCDVIVPDRSTQGGFYPVIYLQAAEPIRSLTVHSSARLTVTTRNGLHVEGWKVIRGLLLDKSDGSSDADTASSQ